MPSEPPSYDAHQEETFGSLTPWPPHYSTLLRVDPFDKTGTKPVGDLAESWTIAKDGLAYTFKLRQGVKFHDGSEMTSQDVKASYDKIIFPPQGMKSSRQATYQAVEAVEAPDAHTIRFRLKWPESSFMLNLASPWNCIYKAEILAKDIHWYEKNVMGTGPFKFVEHVKGSHWVGKKNPDYWDKGKPYLDGYRALFITSSSAQVAAVRGERAHIQFRGFSAGRPRQPRPGAGPQDHRPGESLGLRADGGDAPREEALRRQAGPPRALSSLWTATRARRTSPRSPSSRTWPASRCPAPRGPRRPTSSRSWPATDGTSTPSPARRPSGSSRRRAFPRATPSRSRTAGSRSPTSPSAIWLIDQWRQIGLNVKQEVIEASAYHPMLKRGDFEVAMDFACGFIVEPDLDLHRFVTTSDANYGKHKDKVIDELFQKQARALDPAERQEASSGRLRSG